MKVETFAVDITDTVGMTNVFGLTNTALVPIDLLVNNAGHLVDLMVVTDSSLEDF